MPNHVTNVITSSSLDDLKKMLKGENTSVDFNKLIPQPPELLVSEVSMNLVEMAKASWQHGVVPRYPYRQQALSELSDRDFKDYIEVLISLKHTGSAYWYDWNVENWGTKWNAYSVETDSPKEIRFKTAWSFPAPVAKQLATSGIPFVWEYADEDIGRNFGRFVCGENFFVEAWLDDSLPEIETDEDRIRWCCKLMEYSDDEIKDVLPD